MMSTDEFISIIKGVKAPPVEFLSASLVNAVKYANANVRNAFFPQNGKQTYLSYQQAAVDKVLQELAVKYMCFCLTTNTVYRFNQTIQGSGYNIITDWFNLSNDGGTNSNGVGQRMFMDFMMQPQLLANYFADAAIWAPKIAGEIGSDAFLTGLLIECDTIGSLLPPKIALLMLREMDHDGPNFKQVLKAWVVNKRWSDLEGYDTQQWLETVEPSFRQGGSSYNTINQGVIKACTSQDPPYHFTKPAVSVPRGGSFPAQRYTQITHGGTVERWLSASDGPAVYGLRSSVNPDNTTISMDPSDAGCVVAGTQILLADGSVKRIEEIAEGDKIMSGGGVLSVCSSELVVNDHLTHLYSINNDEPFMSFEHALMTQRGWCSMAPHRTMALTPHHTVKYLTKGDVVWKVRTTERGKIKYEKIIVHRINMHTIAPGEQRAGYDLHLLSGHHTYHANGYCCLVTYPQITAQRVTSNILSDMTGVEQQKFMEQLEQMSPLLGKALGEPVLNAFKKALETPRALASRASHTNQHGVKKSRMRHAANMVVPKFKLSFVTSASSPTAPSEMALLNGHLFIDGALAHTHTTENHVYWRRTLAQGKAEHGMMKLIDSGLAGSGTIRQGDATTSFTANALFGYTCTYGPDKQPWFTFSMGFQDDDKGNLYKVGQLADTANPANNGMLQKARVVFSEVVKVVDNQSQTLLHANIEFDSDYCAFGLSKWIAAEIDFTMDYMHFAGSLYDYDPAGQGYRGNSTNLSGNSDQPADMEKMRQQLTATLFRNPVKTAFLEASPLHAPVTAAVAPALLLADSEPTSVNDLFDLPAPDMENLHQTSFGKLRNLMLLALEGDNASWESWFGETAPTVGPGQALSQQDADLIRNDDIKNFLVNDFSIGYLTQSFSQSTEVNIKAKFDAMPNTADKLAYFWKGDGTTSFAKNKGYGLATSRLMNNTYGEMVDGFTKYMNNNPADWAKQLYDFCTIPVTLNGLALGNTLDGQQRLNHLCMMLYALDPVARIDKGNGKVVSYSTSLHERVTEVRLNEVIRLATVADQNDFADFLTTYYKQYFDSILAGDKWADSIRNEAQQELKDLMDQFAVDNTNALSQAMGGFIADSVALIIGLKDSGPISVKIQKWSEWVKTDEFAQKYPKLARFSNGIAKTPSIVITAFSVGVYIFGVFQAIKAFLNWKDMTPEQRAVAILSVFDIAASVFNDAAAWAAAKKLAAAGEDVQDYVEALETLMDRLNLTGAETLTNAMNEMAELKEPLLVGTDAPGLLAGGEAAARYSSEEADVAARWVRISAVAEVVAKVISIGALAAVAVAGGFQIANDFETGQPVDIKVMDILSEVSNMVALIADIISTVAEWVGTALSVIPVIGIVAAIIGVLINLIMTFLHRKPPPTPQETFVDEHCTPFLQSLLSPPADWLAKQNTTEQRIASLVSIAFA